MVTLSEMASHYNARTDEMPGLWIEGVRDKKDEYRKGLKDIINAPVKDSVVNRFQSRVTDAKDEYSSAIQDKGERLTKRFKEALAA